MVRQRWFVLLIFVALSAWLVPYAQQIEHDDDVLAFLPPDDPDVLAFRAVADRFSMLSVGLVGLRDGGETLLTDERVETIRTLARDLTTVPDVQQVLSFPELPDPRLVDETLVVDVLVPIDLDEPSEIRQRVLSNPNAVGNLISPDGTAACLLVYIPVDLSSAQRHVLLSTIRERVTQAWSGERYFGGAPFMESTAALASRRDIERLSPVVIIVLAVTSALLLGSVVAAILNLVLTGLGVALVMGAHGWMGEPLTIVSSTTPVMMVALGGAFGMHMLAGFQRAQGTSQQRASRAVKELWYPVVLSGLTTSVGFFSLVVMPQWPMRHFAVVAGLGVMLLLGLTIVVLPALMSLVPSRAIPPRLERGIPFRTSVPVWVLLALAGLGAVGITWLKADADTRHVFDETSEPARADRFFNESFGGSQFVQVTIEGNLSEPAVLRRIRSIVEDVEPLDGIAEVRSLLGPVALVTEGLGGRRGIPTSQDRAHRVLLTLAEQSLMAQLMTPDQRGAILHIKLAPGGPEQHLRVARAIQRVVAQHERAALYVGPTTWEDVAAEKRRAVDERLERRLQQPLPIDVLDVSGLTPLADERFLQTLLALRDRAFGTEEVTDPLPKETYEKLSMRRLFETPADERAQLIRTEVPALVSSDPKGVEIVAEQLGMWISEAVSEWKQGVICQRIKRLSDAAEPVTCAEIKAIVSELADETWDVDEPARPSAYRAVPLEIHVTGQPILGAAFATSVTRNLVRSTMLSVVMLVMVLVASGHVRALIPALWTLVITGGCIAALGHPISVGTSMVACIGVGAGVDFALHLGIRARRVGSGADAVRALGGVVVITGVQLSMAFLVLLLSEMPPLRQFGVGLAIALLSAAVGAVWWGPRLG